MLGRFALCCSLEAVQGAQVAGLELAVDSVAAMLVSVVRAVAAGKATAVLAQVTEQVVVLAGMGTIPGSDLVMEPVTAASVPATAPVSARVMVQAVAGLAPDMDLATATALAVVQGKGVMVRVTAQAIIMAQVTVQAVADLVLPGAQGTTWVPLPEQQATAVVMTENG